MQKKIPKMLNGNRNTSKVHTVVKDKRRMLSMPEKIENS